MLEWILEHLGVVVVIVLFIAQMIRGVMQQAREAPRRENRRDALEEERRVREVQEQIRRQIEARRAAQGGAGPAEPPVVGRGAEPAPAPRPETTQLPQPFGGGPLGRMLEELQRRAQQHLPQPVPEPPVLSRGHQLELERQQQIKEQLRAAEEAREVARRRAAQIAAEKAAYRTDRQPTSDLRARLLADLGDPNSLRRAFVLREVLGPPVAMR